LLRKTVSNLMLALLLVGTIAFTTGSSIKETAASGEGSIDWWPMFHHDANRTGYSSSNVSMPIVLLMRSSMTGDKIRSSPAITNDTIYACSLDGYAYAYRGKPPYSPAPIWQSKKQYGSIRSSPCVATNKVYFGSDDKHIVALNASDGREIWNYTTGGAVKSSPVVVDGVLYIGSSDGYLYALDASTGSEIWRYRVAFPVESSPTVFDDTIFFGSNDSRIYALQKNGRIKWFSETEGAIVSSPVVAGGRVFVGSCDNRTYAFDISTGDQIWNYSTNGPIVSSPAVAHGDVFIGSSDKNITALSMTGQFKWNFTTHGPVTSSPAVTADGKVFVCSADGKIYALDATTGGPIWNYSCGSGSSPSIANGMVSIGSDDRCVYLFAGNRPPVADFTSNPQEPIVTQQVIFDGSGSSDPDIGDNITKYRWDFGDGTNIHSTDKITSHQYCAAGTYPVTLTVWDKHEASNTTRPLPLNVSEAWPMFRHDPMHMGLSTSKAPLNNITSWPPFQVGSNVSGDNYMYPSPAVAGDTVFMASMNGTKGVLYALSTDGEMRWSRDLPDRVYSSPLIVDYKVYVGCDNGYVYAFRTSDGVPATTLLISPDNRIRSSPASNGRKIFIGSDSGYVYSIDKITNTILASPYLGGPILSSPAIADGKVFVGTNQGKIYALNETTLGIVRQNATGGAIMSSPTVVDGTVFIGSRDNHVYAFDAKTLNQKWKYSTTGDVDSSSAVANGIVFVGSNDGNVYALNATNGQYMWSRPVGSIGWSSPAIVEGKVFVGSKNKRIYALSITDGSEVWSYQTNGSVESSPAILNDTLYVGSQDGFLYAFHSEAHNVAVLDVTATPTTVLQGRLVNISVTLKNEGSFDETGINVTVTYDSINIDSRLMNLTREERTTLAFSWDTSGVPFGTYTINASATLAGDIDPSDNIKTGGTVTVASSVHDIAVINVNNSKTGCLPMPVVCQNYSARVYVTVGNPGNFTETFNVTVSCNTTIFASQNVTLTSGSIMVVTFVWNTSGFAKGNYSLSACAWPVLNETYTANNNFTDGIIQVCLVGDVNGDGIVDLKDVFAVAKAFGTTRQGPNPPGRAYSPNLDINDDDKIDLKDYFATCKNYGKEDP